MNTEDNYSEILEDLLNNNLYCKNTKKFEVINLGVPGYDIQFSLERFRLRGKKYNPDVVIWLLKNDDFDQIANIIKGKMRFSDKQAEEGILTPAEWREMSDKTRREMTKELDRKKLYQYQESLLNLMRNEHKKALVIFTSPIYVGEEHQKILENFAHSDENIYFGKAISETITDTENIVSPDDTHPNKRGHLLIANDLLRYLIQNRIVPCN